MVKATSKGRERIRATAADIWVTTLEAKLTKAKTTRACLADIFARSKADTARARAILKRCKVRFGKVEQALELAISSVADVLKQLAESV